MGAAALILSFVVNFRLGIRLNRIMARCVTPIRSQEDLAWPPQPPGFIVREERHEIAFERVGTAESAMDRGRGFTATPYWPSFLDIVAIDRVDDGGGEIKRYGIHRVQQRFPVAAL